MSLAQLANRSVLSVSGEKSRQLLASLITNQINTPRPLIFTLFLSPQCKLDSDKFYVDMDAGLVQPFKAHLKKYILRSKIAVDVREDMQVYQLWNNSAQDSLQLPDERRVVQGDFDPRLSELGCRMLYSPDEFKGDECKLLPTDMLLVHVASASVASAQDYLLHRLQLGVPEGAQDYIYNTSLPLEMNADLMNGGKPWVLRAVDFRKGCYLGQELTHRTKHVGVVRKRLAPVMAYVPESPVPTSLKHISSNETSIDPNAEIKLKSEKHLTKRSAILGKTTGSQIGNLGLAVIKLDHVAGLQSSEEQEPLVLPSGQPIVAFRSPVLAKLLF
ncbi:ccr4 associated factor [Kappamyces sp. JEL0680]|nr:ccr4 associated factor [Kappamyces sp. JEL0680]